MSGCMVWSAGLAMSFVIPPAWFGRSALSHLGRIYVDGFLAWSI
jgi:hypothetical protein